MVFKIKQKIILIYFLKMNTFKSILQRNTKSTKIANCFPSHISSKLSHSRKNSTKLFSFGKRNQTILQTTNYKLKAFFHKRNLSVHLSLTSLVYWCASSLKSEAHNGGGLEFLQNKSFSTFKFNFYVYLFIYLGFVFFCLGTEEACSRRREKTRATKESRGREEGREAS
jgi:hypothetical protein